MVYPNNNFYFVNKMENLPGIMCVMLGGGVGTRPTFPLELLSSIAPASALTDLRRAYGEFLMWQHSRDVAVPSAVLRKQLERLAAQIDQMIKTLSRDDFGEELVQGLELGGARHPVRSLVEISGAAGWYLENMNPPSRGRPVGDVKYFFAKRVASCLENAGVSLTATRKGDHGKDGVFVAVLRILFEAAGESIDPHGLAEKVLSERPLARS